MSLVLVHEKTRYVNSYGDFNQDGDTEVYRIYQLDGSDRHFKQVGFQSSYSDHAEWESEMVEVSPRQRVGVVYEYEDV